MANTVIGFPNRVDSDYYSVAFSGGGWLASLPLTNLADPLFQRVARSNGLTTGNTQFTVDLGIDRDISVIAIPSHNMSDSAQYRIRAYTDALLANNVYDSGWSDVWQIVYPFGSLPFSHPSWFTGTIAREDQSAYPMPIVEVIDTVIARYWKIEFSDSANIYGYVDISRLFLCAGWQTTLNPAFGFQLGWTTDTGVETSLGGSDFYDRRPGRRFARFSIDFLEEDEAYTWPFEIQRAQGIDKQVFFVFDPDDTTHLARRAFACTLSQLSPLEHVTFDRAQVAFELREVK